MWFVACSGDMLGCIRKNLKKLSFRDLKLGPSDNKVRMTRFHTIKTNNFSLAKGSCQLTVVSFAQEIQYITFSTHLMSSCTLFAYWYPGILTCNVGEKRTAVFWVIMQQVVVISGHSIFRG